MRSLPPSPKKKTILFIGASIMSGYGLSRNESLPWQTVDRLSRDRRRFGSKTIASPGASAADNLQMLLRYIGELEESDKPKFSHIVISSGIGDPLLGHPISKTKHTLDSMIRILKHHFTNAKIHLFQHHVWQLERLGMTLRQDERLFTEMFQYIANLHNVHLLFDMFEPVLGSDANFQADNLHLNATGVGVLADKLARIISEF